MITLLIVTQLLITPPVAIAVRPGAAVNTCCTASVEARVFTAIAADLVVAVRNTFRSAPGPLIATVKTGISYVRAAVGVVMRRFVGAMLGSKAFLRAGRRS